MNPPLLRAAAAGATLVAAATSLAQTDTPNPPPPTTPQRVEITGGRESDADQRRQSTAAKIVIGREEIDRYGDSTLGEVLRRLPGITVPGAPGRGGGPRMRGLGAGYTQILIDGQRVPPGFSLEQLTPDQVERIEILRAPTAETGARAIGGTINIITREGYRRRINDLRVGFGFENGQTTPGLAWTRNDTVGDLVYNLSSTLFRNRRESAGIVVRSEEDLTDGELERAEVETNRGVETRIGLNATARLQWRLSGGDMLVLMPILFTSRNEGARDYRVTSTGGREPPLYDQAHSDNDGSFTVLRLNLNWRAGLAGGRVETNAAAARASGESSSLREERSQAGTLLRTLANEGRTRDHTLTLNSKFSRTLASEHSLVAGAEAENLRRSEARTTLQDGAPLLTDFGDNLQASSLRLAAYVQDEWSLSPQWAAHAGLRWESITTRGDAGAAALTHEPRNRSSVVTPLLHAVWKPDPKVRDQVRVSLTRSYKAPTLQNLVARPTVSARYPVAGGNTATSADRAGNPDLRPELATGIDVAVERYLKDGGVLSANLFHRRLTDYMRNVTALEAVSWSPVPRWVSRPQNIGSATTQGIELEAKFRLDQAVDGAWPVELRGNLSLFSSKVDAVPGPDNRLDQQPKGTANLGADYRIRGTPLTLGGSLNLTPSYRTRVSEDEVVDSGRRRQFDAYALWVFGPAAQLRLLASNLGPADYVSGRSYVDDRLRAQSTSIAETYTNWQLRLELKL